MTGCEYVRKPRLICRSFNIGQKYQVLFKILNLNAQYACTHYHCISYIRKLLADCGNRIKIL